MSRDAALLGAAARLGWSRVDGLAPKLALVGAAVAVVVEATGFLWRWPASFVIGGLPVAPSIVPLLVVAALTGGRALGRARSGDAARTFWVLSILGLAVGGMSLSTGREPTTVVALLLVGLGEEFMYRGAIPALVGFALARYGGVRPRTAGIVGLTVGGIAFVGLPGHVAQWDSAAAIMPFVAFAVLAALAVWRTGALLEVAMLHAVLNTVNIGRFDGAPDPAGALLLAGLMAVLVVAYVPAAAERDLVIDLTGDEPEVRLGESEPAGLTLVD